MNEKFLFRMDYSLEDLFKFGKRSVTSYMMYQMKLDKKFRESFNYIVEKLVPQELKDLNELRWIEGKNYDWAAIQNGSVTLLIRKYQKHYTVYCKKSGENSYFNRYGCFMYVSNNEDDNDFVDINLCIKDIVTIIEKDELHTIWNNYSFTRPVTATVTLVWSGGTEDIDYVDEFIFCCEELFSKFLELFAETDMVNMVGTFAEGDVLNNRYEILRVSTESKDGYFHGIGLELKGTNGTKSKSFCDVYTLTRYYLNDVLKSIKVK